MNQNVLVGIVIAVVAIVLIGGGWYYVSSQDGETSTSETEETVKNDSATEKTNESADTTNSDNTNNSVGSNTNTADTEGSDATDSTTEANSSDSSGSSATEVESDDSSQDTKEEAPAEKQAAAGKYVKYEDVNIADLEGTIVLDFSATWCPTCQAFKKEITANPGKIPAGVTIVSVDYDSNKVLRKKYGVTVQHTFVEVTSDGEKVKMWQGGSTVDSVIDKI